MPRKGSRSRGFKSHYPARGRKLGICPRESISSNVQISLPRKGTETRAPSGPGAQCHRVQISLPRKGTETMMSNSLSNPTSLGSNLITPQGDGNRGAQILDLPPKLVQISLPRKGTETPVIMNFDPHIRQRSNLITPQGDGNPGRLGTR